jgi:hypothetical protein
VLIIVACGLEVVVVVGIGAVALVVEGAAGGCAGVDAHATNENVSAARSTTGLRMAAV